MTRDEYAHNLAVVASGVLANSRSVRELDEKTALMNEAEPNLNVSQATVLAWHCESIMKAIITVSEQARL